MTRPLHSSNRKSTAGQGHRRSCYGKQYEGVGLLPQAGWRKRNVQFIQSVLLPSYFRKRGSAVAEPLAEELRGSELGLTWIGHATFLLESTVANLVFDPNWAMWHGPVRRQRHPGMPIDELPEIDAVLVSHAHFDHLHLPSLRKLARAPGSMRSVIVPRGVGDLVSGLGFSRVIELAWGETTTLRTNRGTVEIEMTPAQHWGARYIHDGHREYGGFLVTLAGRTVYHAGDTAFFEAFEDIGERADIDLALLPIGAYDAPSGRPVHMNPKEAVQAFRMLGANVAVPMHHGTFPLGGEPLQEPESWFRSAMNDAGLQSKLVVPSEGTAYPL